MTVIQDNKDRAGFWKQYLISGSAYEEVSIDSQGRIWVAGGKRGGSGRWLSQEEINNIRNFYAACGIVV